MNSVVHFEMPYDNPERIAKFYHKAFGWETQALGEKMGNYVLATTTETDSNRRPRHPGAINGGFFPKQSDRPAQHPSIVIAVDDIEEATDRVKFAGGRVIGEAMDIPGVGRYVSFMDPEGNRVSMLEPSRSELEAVTSEKREQQWSPRHTNDGPVAAEHRDAHAHSGSSKTGGRDRTRK